MKLSIIRKLDETIAAIKLKDNVAEFGQATIDQFEFYLLLVLEIIRYEIIKKNSISDETAYAASILITFQVFEYYYRDYPDLYKKCTALANEFGNYNANWSNHDLSGNLKTKGNWVKFFRESITKMVQEKGLYDER